MRESARKEFEDNRHVSDPIEVAKMIYVGRDCLMQVQNKVINQACASTRAHHVSNGFGDFGEGFGVHKMSPLRTLILFLFLPPSVCDATAS